MNLDYSDYLRVWCAGHFENERQLASREWYDKSPDMRAVTINVLEHQQHLLADRARKAGKDIPKTEPEVVW